MYIYIYICTCFTSEYATYIKYLQCFYKTMPFLFVVVFVGMFLGFCRFAHPPIPIPSVNVKVSFQGTNMGKNNLFYVVLHFVESV